jgi:multidrug efflux pump subunit AcrA (membrane-fusion protein)
MNPRCAFAAWILLVALAVQSPASEPLILHLTAAPFQETITREATLESASSRVVRAPGFAGDRILIWLAEEGTQVKKGDVVARFDPTPVQLGLDRAMVKKQGATDRVEALEADWGIRLESEKIRSKQLDSTLAEAKRQQTASRFLPEIPKSIASVKRDLASGQSEGAEKKLSLLKDSSIRQRNAAVDSAQRLDHDLQSTLGALDETVLLAKASGFISLLPVTLSGLPPRKVQTGDFLERRQPFLKIHPSVGNLLQIAVSARELTLVKVGQHVEFKLRAVADQNFYATISDIPGFALASPKGRAPFFAVLATIPSQPGLEGLHSGMTATAHIRIANVESCLAVPSDWVFQDGKKRLLCQAPNGTWEALALPDNPTRAGDFFLLPDTFAQANTTGGLRIKSPPLDLSPSAPIQSQ